jgi:hypothetical protein
MTGINNRVLTPVVFPPLEKGAAPKNPAAAKAVPPSLAQFAINQQLHQTPRADKGEALTPAQPDAVTVEVAHPVPAAGNELRSLSIYRDADSGKFVSIIRDVASGEVIEQIPEDEMLQFLSRMEHAQKSLLLPKAGSGVNLEA